MGRWGTRRAKDRQTGIPLRTGGQGNAEGLGTDGRREDPGDSGGTGGTGGTGGREEELGRRRAEGPGADGRAGLDPCDWTEGRTDGGRRHRRVPERGGTSPGRGCFSVSETGTGAGRGKGGAARPRGSPGPAKGSALTHLRARGQAPGVAAAGVRLPAGSGACARAGIGGPRPGRPGGWGSIPPASARRRVRWSLGGPRGSTSLPGRCTRKYEGAGRRNLTQVPARPRPAPRRARPAQAPPPPAGSGGSRASPPCADHSV